MNVLTIDPDEYAYQDYLDTIDQMKKSPRPAVPEALQAAPWAVQINLWVLPPRGTERPSETILRAAAI